MVNLRTLTAEFLGTFALVFVGAGAVITDAARDGAVGLIGIALANGLVFAIMVTATMRISGGHLNPAISFGLWLANRVDAKTAGAYILVQLVGGVTAAFLAMALFPQVAGEISGYGVPRIAVDVDIIEAILIEAVLTFFLVSAVFGTVVAKDAPPIGGFGVGLTLLICIIVGGPMTGSALNPARAFGPALVAGEWTGHATYWIGPLLGGAVAAFLWGRVLLRES